MTDLERAVARLREENRTCVLCRGDCFYTSDAKGIAPMMAFLDAKNDLRGFSAADRVVGRAAAMLFVLAGVRAVYAEVISHGAIDILSTHGIEVTYNCMTDRIMNRAGDGFCPMETAVLEIEDPNEALEILRRRLVELRSQNVRKKES